MTSFQQKRCKSAITDLWKGFGKSAEALVRLLYLCLHLNNCSFKKKTNNSILSPLSLDGLKSVHSLISVSPGEPWLDHELRSLAKQPDTWTRWPPSQHIKFFVRVLCCCVSCLPTKTFSSNPKRLAVTGKAINVASLRFPSKFVDRQLQSNACPCCRDVDFDLTSAGLNKGCWIECLGAKLRPEVRLSEPLMGACPPI